MEKVFAVLVDGENFKSDAFTRVLAEVEKHGSVALKWVYADWTNGCNKSWEDVLELTASRPKQQFHYTKKDDADHALIMDAIELINNNKRINSVCLVTSDGGFASLAQRIREYGIYSMVIGEKKSPKRLIRACENFVDINNIDRDDTVENDKDLDLEALLIKAYHRAEIDGEAYLGNFGTAIKRIDPSFDHRNYKVASLKKLIKSCDDIFQITQEANDRFYFTLKMKTELNTAEIERYVKGSTYCFAKCKSRKYFVHKSEFTNPEDWKSVKTGSMIKFQFDEKNSKNGNEIRALNISIAN
ncbi:NYN domain-containing protein [Pseudoalteromonas gelatinilytica]